MIVPTIITLDTRRSSTHENRVSFHIALDLVRGTAWRAVLDGALRDIEHHARLRVVQVALHPLPVPLAAHAPLHGPLESRENAAGEAAETPLVAFLDQALEPRHGGGISSTLALSSIEKQSSARLPPPTAQVSRYNTQLIR